MLCYPRLPGLTSGQLLMTESDPMILLQVSLSPTSSSRLILILLTPGVGYVKGALLLESSQGSGVPHQLSLDPNTPADVDL